MKSTNSRPQSGRPPEQLWIDGTAPPHEPDVASVKDSIYAWLDARVAQKRAGDEAKVAHERMLAELASAGLEWHPYLDPSSGKRKRVWVKREPKAATSVVAPPPPPPRKRRERTREQSAAAAGDEDATIEMRRVPRASVEKEIDGFGSVRERMEAKQADAAKQAEKLPTRGKGKRGK